MSKSALWAGPGWEARAWPQVSQLLRPQSRAFTATESLPPPVSLAKRFPEYPLLKVSIVGQQGW